MKLPAALRLSPEWAPYVFLSPFVALFAVFGVFPLAFSLDRKSTRLNSSHG